MRIGHSTGLDKGLALPHQVILEDVKQVVREAESTMAFTKLIDFGEQASQSVGADILERCAHQNYSFFTNGDGHPTGMISSKFSHLIVGRKEVAYTTIDISDAIWHWPKTHPPVGTEEYCCVHAGSSP
jgi:hypothetical protein